MPPKSSKHATVVGVRNAASKTSKSASIPQPQTGHDSFSSSSSSSSNGSSSEAEEKKIDSSTLKPPTATSPSKTSKYKCPTCNKSFSTDQGLQYHLSPSCHIAFSSKKLSALKSYLAPNDSLVENFKVNVTKTRYEFVSSEGIQFRSMKAVAEHFEVSPNSSNSSTPDISPAKISSSSPPRPLISIPPRQILTLLKTLTRTSLNQPWGIKLSTILSAPRDCCGSEGCRIRVRKTLIRISEISGIGLNQGLRKGDMIMGFWGGECDDFGVLTSVMRNAMTIEITIKRYETIGERREREEEEERKEKEREERREGVKDRLRRSIFVKKEKEKEKGSEVIVKSEMEEESEDLLFDVEVVEEDNFVEANLSLIERHTQEEEDGDMEEEGLFEGNDDGLFGDSDSDEGGEKGKAEKNGGKEKGSSIFMGEVEESEDDMSMSDDDDDDDDGSDDSNDDLGAPQTTSKTTTPTTTTSTSNNNNNNADDIDNRTNSDVDPTNPPETIDLLSDSEDEVQIIESLDKPPTEIVEIPDSPSKPPKKPKERIRPKAKKKPSQRLPLPPPPPLPPSTSNKKIHVSNLPSSATQNDLFVYFALAGKVTFVTLPPIPINHVIRSAVVKFKDGSSAEKAVSEVGNWKEFTSQFDQGLGLQAMYKLKVRFFNEEPPEMTRKKRSRSFSEGTGGKKVKVKEIKRAVSDPMGGVKVDGVGEGGGLGSIPEGQVPPHGAPLLVPRAEPRGLGWELETKRAESEPKKKGTENEEKEERKRAKQQRKKEKTARLAELVQATNVRNYVSVEGFPHNFNSTKLPEVFQHCGKVVSFARGISGENRDRTEPRHYYVEFENGAQANTCATANHAKRSFFKNLMGKLSVIPVKPHKNATVNPNYNMQPFHGFVRFSLNTLPHNKPLTSVKLFSKKNHVVYIKTVAEFFENGEAAVPRVVFTAIGHNLTEGFVQFKLRKKVNPKQTNAQTEHTKIAEATAAAINLNGEKLCGVSVRTYYDTSTKAERHNQTNIINELRMKSQETADL